MTLAEPNGNGIDFLFTEIGEFGMYQVITYTLLCIPNAMMAMYVVSFVFTANALDYRCMVSECDGTEGIVQYDQPWLTKAIPTTNSSLDNCLRYGANRSTAIGGDQCLDGYFDRTVTQKCDAYVFRTDERTIQNEFGLMCGESYKLALVGTAGNMGRFISMPLAGLLSDKYGRRTILIVGMFLGCLFGIIKSFSVNYWMFLVLEFIDASACGCIFSAVYVITVEWVSSKHRVLGTTIISLFFPIGEIILGCIAMNVHDFRILLRIIYVPGLLIVFYFWLVPESIRWLLVTGRTKRAEKELRSAAYMNRRTISDKTIQVLQSQYGQSPIELSGGSESTFGEVSMAQSLSQIVRSSKLFIRLVNSCFCWMACAFCYYGLMLSSTKIRGNQDMYVSFMMVAAAEIPGLLSALLLLNRIGRRALLCGAMAIAGFSTIISPWIPSDHSTVVLVLFIVSKCTITCAFSVLYIFTAEMWPTNLRTTMLALCSTIGRSGAMLATLAPLLGIYFTWLPFVLFGGSAILGAFLTLFSPETLNKKLPDNIDDAKNL